MLSQNLSSNNSHELDLMKYLLSKHKSCQYMFFVFFTLILDNIN